MLDACGGREGDADLAAASFAEAHEVLDQPYSQGIEDRAYLRAVVWLNLANLRATQPADIAILFRSRESHREFESALERRGVLTYVYKGQGFFEAAEIHVGSMQRRAPKGPSCIATGT